MRARKKLESRDSPRKISDTSEKGKERSVKHSKIKFEVSTAGEADFDRFIQAIEEFHRDENTQWDRNSLSPSTKATMRSQWSRWNLRLEGEEWMTIPTDRFVLFVKSIKHSYFKEATDSKYIDVSTRIIKVLQQTKTNLHPQTAVRQLENLNGRFEASELNNTNLVTMRSLDLEQIREAFRENICPMTEGDPKARKYIAEILVKGPDANAKGNAIPPGTTLHTWMEDMINEAFTIESSIQISARYYCY